MPVNKPVKKRGPYKKKEILPPAIGEPVSPPAMEEPDNTIEIDGVAMILLEWLGEGDRSAGLSKAMGYIISLDRKTLEKIRDL